MDQLRERIGDAGTAQEAENMDQLRERIGDAGTAQEAMEGAVQATEQRFLQQVITNMDVPEAEAQILTEGFSTGDADVQTYARGIYEAFELGRMGLTYEQAQENRSQEGLNETQFQHAWEIGARKAGTGTQAAAEETSAPEVPEYESIEDFSREFTSPEQVTAIFDQAADTDVNEFAAGFRRAYDMGQSGVGASYATADTIPTLTDEQRTAAFELGRSDAAARAAEQAGKVQSQRREGRLSRVKGTVKGEGVTIADLKKTFNDRQNTAYRLLTRYAETTGVNIVLYNSQADENGYFPAAQGRFQWKDNTIYVDINSGVSSARSAGELGQYTMLRTFAHEFTHFIEKWNAQQYNEFRQFVFETLEGRGEDVNDLIEGKQAQDESGKMTYEQASREVVADAMMDILPDSRLVQQLAQEHQSVFKTLLRKLREFSARLRQYYRGITTSIPEANMLKENGAYLSSIVDMWDRIARGAVDNYQAANGEAVQQSEQKPARQQKKARNVQVSEKSARNEGENAQNRAENAQAEEKAPAEEDDFSDINPEEVRAELEKRGIVGGQVVDQEKNAQSPFIQQVMQDVDNLSGTQEPVTDTNVGDTAEEEAAPEAPESTESAAEPETQPEAETPVRKGSADAFSRGDIFNEKQVKAAARNKAARQIIEKIPKEAATDESTEAAQSAAPDVRGEAGDRSDGTGAVRVSPEPSEGAVPGDAEGRQPDTVPAEERAGAGRDGDRPDAKRNGRGRSKRNGPSRVQSGRESGVTQQAPAVQEAAPAEEAAAPMTPEEHQRQTEELHETAQEQVEQKSTEAPGGQNFQIGESLDLPAAFWRITEQEEIEYSNRRGGGLSNREILSMAADELGEGQLSDTERNALDIFRQRLTRLQEAQEQREALGRQYKDQQFTKGGSREEAGRILSAMRVLDSKIKSLENSVLSLENKDVLKGVLEKARRVVELQEKKRGDETLKRYRERRNESAGVTKYRQRVRNEVETLRKWLMTPSNKDIKKHVPAEIQKTVADFLESINLMSKKALRTSGLETTKADEKYLKNMWKLRDAIKRNVDSSGLYSGYNDLPVDFMETFEALIQKAEQHISTNSGVYVVNQMSAAELRELSHTLKALRKFITTMNVFHNNAMFQHAYDAGEESIEYLSQFERSKKSGFLHKFFSFDYMRPSYAFERMGKGGQSIEHEFREGQAVQARLANRIIEFAKSTYTAKEVKAWGEETRTFTLSDGESVTLPVTHLMSLYCLNKRPQALTHIYGDGIRVANYQNGKQVQLDEGHVVSIEDVQKMIGTLTDRQKAVADALQKYMSTETAAWGNYVSMARFDVEQFTEENYFPINSDGRYLAATADETPDNAGLYALLNSSFTKELKENARNRIILYNIFDVFANHTASMTQYRAFALPVLDALKWFNYKNDETSVRTKLSSAFGAPVDERAGSGSKGYAEQFVINLLRAYNGTAAQGDPYDSLGLKSLHRFNRAQIAFNARVVIQQPMAVTRAAMMLSPTKLLRGLGMSAVQMRKLAAEMEEHSGIAAWKALGFYDTNISRGLTELIKQNPTFGDQVTEIGTKGAETADRFTWAAMWYAAKSSVNRSAYESEADYFQAVTELFEDVIYKTQVVDSVLTKSEFLRAKGFFPRALGSFMSEPMTTTSMLTSAYYKYTDDIQRGMSRSEAWKRIGGLIAKTAAVYTIGQILLAAMQSAADAWRDDDEYDSENWLNNFFQKYLAAFKTNVIEELLPFGKVPVLSELYEETKSLLDYAGVFDKLGLDMYGNDISNGWAQYAKYLQKGAEITIDLIQGNRTNYTPYGAIYNFIRGAAGLTGYPIATAWREVQDMWNNTVGYFAPNMKLDTYQRAIDRTYMQSIRPTGLAQKTFEKILADADARGDGNGSLKQDELGAELLAAMARGDINEEQAAAVWNSRGWKKTFETWQGKEEPSPAATAAPESTSGTRIQLAAATPSPTPTAAPAATARPSRNTEAGTYSQFSSQAPIYGSDRKRDAYAVWENELKPSGMSLERFTRILSTADSDGNGSLKQNELGYALHSAIDRGEMSRAQASAVWASQGWAHDFDYWSARH
jgi:hypothetical protein